MVPRILGIFSALVLFARIAQGQSLSFSESQIDLVLLGGIRHADVSVSVSLNSVLHQGALKVTSDVGWVLPIWEPSSGRIRLSFANQDLSVSQTATLHVETAGATNDFFVHGTLTPLNVVRMINDPNRGRVLALHNQGTGRGSLIALEAGSGQPVASRTLGFKPTDLVVQPERDEILVILAGDRSVSVVDPESLEIRYRIPLPVYVDWGLQNTSANLGVGPGNILYYTDGTWAPVLYVWNRELNTVVQQVNLGGFGTGGFAVDPARGALVAWAQYGWTAGAGNSWFTRFDIQSDGTLTQRETTSDTNPIAVARDPLDAPVLWSADGTRVFAKQYALRSNSVSSPTQAFPETIYAISPGGEIAVGNVGVYQSSNGSLLMSLPAQARQPVVTLDYSRIVYFDGANRRIESIDFARRISSTILNSSLIPRAGSVVLPPARLEWSTMPGATGYRVYFGATQAAVESASPASPEYLGLATTNSWALTVPPTVGREHFWRIDPLFSSGAVPGTVNRFFASTVASPGSRIDATTLSGVNATVATLELTGASAGVAWRFDCPASWVVNRTPTGVTPAVVEIVVDASGLAPGTYTNELRFGPAAGPLASIPFSLRVDPLNITHLKSERGSKWAYGVSEDASATVPKAVLVEIDTETETITRTVEVGSSVTDLAIHTAEDRIYVPNWRSGRLLAVNRGSFRVARTYNFTPFGGVGSGGGDVFRVTAGAAGRLTIEEADQWIRMYQFDTALGQATVGPFVREGGGGGDPTGEFYYHGENNSSGATLQRYQISGTQMNLLGSIRVESANYYGSRIVTVSDDGGRIFWNGSVFSPSLTEVWQFGRHILACTPEGRYAFGFEHVLDVNRRVQILQMPAGIQVSAYNSATRKLLVPADGRIRFYGFDPAAISLAAPVFKAPVVAPTSIQLNWDDLSLELGFAIQYRLAGAAAWNDLQSAPANSVSRAVTGLLPETAYEFRIRATGESVGSEWSPVFAASTPGFPPTAPSFLVASPTPRRVELSWTNPERETGLRLERTTDSWTNRVSWWLSANRTNFADTNVVAGTSYEYRLVATNLWAETPSAATARVLVPVPAPPTPPDQTVARLLTGLRVAVAWRLPEPADSVLVERLFLGTNALPDLSSSNWVAIATRPGNATSAVDDAFAEGAHYSYRVTVSNEVGAATGAASAPIRVVQLECLLSDDFNAGPDRWTWSSIVGGGGLTNVTGFEGGAGLWFGHSGTRAALTVPMTFGPGSSVQFAFRFGRTTGPTSNPASSGVQVVALDGSSDGFTWFRLSSLTNESFGNSVRWTNVLAPVPTSLLGRPIQLRWSQTIGNPVFDLGWGIDSMCALGPVPAALLAPVHVLAGAGSATALNVYWSAVPNSTGYRVERLGEDRRWREVARIRPDTTWFRDENGVPSSTFAYRVRTFYGPAVSNPSTPAFGTTLSQIEEWRVLELGRFGDDSALSDEELRGYAFNLAPGTPPIRFRTGGPNSGIPDIRADSVSGAFEIRMLRRRSHMNPGVEYRVEVSPDLVDWTAAGTESGVQPIDNLWEEVRVVVPAGTGDARYCRVRILAR